MALYLITLIPVIIFTLMKTRKSFHMMQQNFYNDDNRYMKWVNNNKKKVILASDIIFILSIIVLFLDYKISLILYPILYPLLYIVVIIMYLKKPKVKDKKPLVVTARVKRLYFTMFLIYFIAIIPFVVNYSNDRIWLSYVIVSFLTCMNWLLVVIANIINKPMEKMVYFYYRFKAVDKLKKMNIPVVGITGSYGKTSTKNIVNTILNAKLNSFASPKSFNTPLGLMNTINNYLDKFNDIFLAEMGAFKLGEIKQDCDLVKPKYGIITTIGEAHLETFGSRDNIMKGKMELVESLPSDGFAILNKDDEYQRKYKIKNDCKIYWIGIDNKETDLYATNIKLSGSGTTFECVFKGDNNKYTFTTKLLGKHNVYNILDGILLGYKLGLSIDQLKRGVSSLKPTEHRLELKKYGNINIIDDAYNSNPVGSRMAVEVLGLMKGTKIIVTPGMIELGEKQYELNKKFGEYISKVCDYVILVGEKQTKPIYDGLVENKYDKRKIFVLNDVRDAFPLMSKLAKDTTYVLLENDLPDLFNE